MSSITTDKGILHYEVFGRGSPVIFLHGWLGSWVLWQEIMEGIGKTNRTYALDFWGFGESDDKLSTYQVQDFVNLVEQFMDQMGIYQAPLVGHSMGGTVSLMAAMQLSPRIQKVVVIGSPIKGSSLSLPLKIAGNRFVAERIFHFFSLFRMIIKRISPFISNYPGFPDIMDRDISKTKLDSFLNSIHSLKKIDLSEDLKNMETPVLGLYGIHDNIVAPAQNKLLQQIIPHAKIEIFQNSGHFIMLEEPESCMHYINKFIN